MNKKDLLAVIKFLDGRLRGALRVLEKSDDATYHDVALVGFALDCARAVIAGEPVDQWIGEN